MGLVIECLIMHVSIDEWITATPDKSQQELRRAVHVVLMAISEMRRGGITVVMKGGILLAVGHTSDRYTRDIDFSTPVTQHELDPDEFVKRLDAALAVAVDASPHGLDCKVQSHKLNPPSMASVTPTLQIRVGYAPLADVRRRRHLARGNSSTVVAVDLSYNEVVTAEEIIDLGDGVEIIGSTIVDVVGEKYRAMLQQPIRNRARRQDAFDIYTMLSVRRAELDAGRSEVLVALIAKCRDRGVNPHRAALRDPQVVARSSAAYPALASDIPGVLPSFDVVYGVVLQYYESLPWDDASTPSQP